LLNFKVIKYKKSILLLQFKKIINIIVLIKRVELIKDQINRNQRFECLELNINKIRINLVLFRTFIICEECCLLKFIKIYQMLIQSEVNNNSINKLYKGKECLKNL